MSKNDPVSILLPINRIADQGQDHLLTLELQKIPGFLNLEFQSNGLRLSYDPDNTDLFEIQRAFKAAGVSIPTNENTLNVAGMTCISCVAHVSGALTDLPGVIEAEASLRQGSVRVQFVPGAVTLERIRSAISKAGYTVG